MKVFRTPLALTLLLASGFQLPSAAGSAADASSGQTAPVGPDVRVNDSSRGGRYLHCVAQMGPSVAALGSDIYVVYNDASNCRDPIPRDVFSLTDMPEPPLNRLSLARSTDGGKTFVDFGPLVPNGNVWELNGQYLANPSIAIDTSGEDRGRIYVASEAKKTDPPVGLHRNLTVAVGVSDDGGETVVWRGSFPAQGPPWIAVDNTGGLLDGSVYVVWSQGEYLGSCAMCEIKFARSMDGGVSWSTPVRLSANLDVKGGRVAVGADGEIYVVWEQGVGTSSPSVWGRVSFDGGDTFSQPREIASTTPTGHDQNCPTRRRVLDGDIRSNEFPSIAVDSLGSSDPDSPDYNPARGTVYLTLAGRGDSSEDESDVYFTRLEPGEQEWSAPVRANDDDTPADQFFPEVVVPGPAQVAVVWTDRRADMLNLSMEQWMVTSDDAGVTFGPNVKFSSGSSPPSLTNPPVYDDPWFGGTSWCYGGDRNALATDGTGRVVAAWTDNRDGFLGTPGAGIPEPNIYFNAAQITELPL